MHLICTQENFKRAIFNSEKVVSKQTTLPILNNILFEADKKGLTLSATNLEMGVIAHIGAKVEKEGKITIPAKLISNVINNLPVGENITLEVIDQNLKIKSGSIKAVIKGLSASDFPLIPHKSTDFQFQLSANDLKRIITKIMVSVAFHESRQELTGINVVLKEREIFFASTDSFRLSENRINLGKDEVNEERYTALREKTENIIIPAVTLMELNRIISGDEEGKVKVAIEEGQIFFEIPGTTIISRLINGKYPEYKHIVPQEFKTRAVIEKSFIQGAVKMAGFFTTGKTSEISLEIHSEKKKVIIQVHSSEIGENVSEMEADITGPSQKVVFNSKYLLDGINNIATSKVALLVNSESTPVALREINEETGEVLGDYLYIVMPIKN